MISLRTVVDKLRSPLVSSALVLGLGLTLVGAVYPTITGIFALVSVAVLYATFHQQRFRTKVIPRFSLVFLGLAAWTMVQLLPWPARVLGFLAPRNLLLWRETLQPLQPSLDRWFPISLAPELTRLEVVKWLVYAVFAWAGLSIGQRNGIKRVALVTLILSMLALSYNTIHALFGLKKLFGVFQTELAVKGWDLGPLLNSNHFSAYLSLGVFSGVALLYEERSQPGSETALKLVSVIALIIGILVAASRAAVVALVIGAVLVWWVQYQPKKPHRKRHQSANPPSKWWIPLVFIVGLGLALYGFREQVLQGLSQKDMSKLKAFRDCLPMIRDHWKVGIGRGAFDGSFFAYRSYQDYLSWTHPENILIQWCVEWGVPVTMVALGSISWIVWRSPGLRTDLPTKIFGIGILINIVHNMFDYSLEIPAIAALVAFQLGALEGTPRASRSVSSGKSVNRGFSWHDVRVYQFLGTLLLIVTFGVSLFLRRPYFYSQARTELFQWSKQEVIYEPDNYLRKWIVRFPTDPYLRFVGGNIKYRTNPQQAMGWYAASLQRGPFLGPAHMGVARVLARMGLRSQAMLETKNAINNDASVVGQASQLAVFLAQNPEEVLAVQPKNSQVAIAFLMGAFHRMQIEKQDTIPILKAILKIQPCHIFARSTYIQRQFQRIKDDEVCVRDQIETCVPTLEKDILYLESCSGGHALSLRYRSEYLWVHEKKRDSIPVLQQSCEQETTGSVECYKLLASRAFEFKSEFNIERFVRLAVSRQCSGQQACANGWAWACSFYAGHSLVSEAYTASKKAVEYDPSNLSHRKLAASMAIRVGAYSSALVHIDYVLHRQPKDSTALGLKVRIDAVKNQKPTTNNSDPKLIKKVPTKKLQPSD
jgi:hypothetical protein